MRVGGARALPRAHRDGMGPRAGARGPPAQPRSFDDRRRGRLRRVGRRRGRSSAACRRGPADREELSDASARRDVRRCRLGARGRDSRRRGSRGRRGDDEALGRQRRLRLLFGGRRDRRPTRRRSPRNRSPCLQLHRGVRPFRRRSVRRGPPSRADTESLRGVQQRAEVRALPRACPPSRLRRDGDWAPRQGPGKRGRHLRPVAGGGSCEGPVVRARRRSVRGRSGDCSLRSGR